MYGSLLWQVQQNFSVLRAKRVDIKSNSVAEMIRTSTMLSLSSQTLILLTSVQPPQSVSEHLKTLSQLDPDTWIQCISISTCTNTTFTLHREMPNFLFQSWTVKPKSQWGMRICDCVCARMYPINWMKSRYWNDTIRCVANQFIFHLPQVVSLRQSPSEFAHTSRTTHVFID